MLTGNTGTPRSILEIRLGERAAVDATAADHEVRSSEQRQANPRWH